jgi:dTDP-4-dehydrorhamnose reductase
MSGPILVFGAGGQLGQEFLALAPSRGIEVKGLTRAEADITDAAAVEEAINTIKPRLVLNAAAYTAVDKAESEQHAAFASNVQGAENISRAAAKAFIPIVHISTDYVFDGSKAGAYVETDPLKPLGVYGRSKADGEAAVRAANPQHIILRTAWVFGPFGANFLKTMLRLARERDALRVVADQHGCPTSTLDIAEAVLAVDAALTRRRDLWGVYHFTGSGATNWHQFASAIVEAQARYTGRKPSVEAITTADYPTPAKRPANSELDASLFAATFGYSGGHWTARTKETVDILCAVTPQ